jgi:hypothetical protein
MFNPPKETEGNRPIHGSPARSPCTRSHSGGNPDIQECIGRKRGSKAAKRCPNGLPADPAYEFSDMNSVFRHSPRPGWEKVPSRRAA